MLNWTNPKKLGNDYYFTFKETDYEKLSPLEAAFHTVDYIKKKLVLFETKNKAGITKKKNFQHNTV